MNDDTKTVYDRNVTKHLYAADGRICMVLRDITRALHPYDPAELKATCDDEYAEVALCLTHKLWRVRPWEYVKDRQATVFEEVMSAVCETCRECFGRELYVSSGLMEDILHACRKAHV